jgi:hypothetical protein
MSNLRKSELNLNPKNKKRKEKDPLSRLTLISFDAELWPLSASVRAYFDDLLEFALPCTIVGYERV